MKTNVLDFHYPEELVALEPLKKRSDARMLVYHRGLRESQMSHFSRLPDFLSSNDLVVFNSTRVMKARFFAEKISGAKLEGLFLGGNESSSKVWLQGHLKSGDRLLLKKGSEVEVVERSGKEALLNLAFAPFFDYLKEYGEVPIPPYIRKLRKKALGQDCDGEDKENYQSIFADSSKENSFAASTAALHFDLELIHALQEKGVQTENICLHIGLGTFAPIEVEETQDFKIHSETVEISKSSWERILCHKKNGGRIVAVGTTVCRSLESAYVLSSGSGFQECFEADLFIHPSFKFQMVDALITNFHQPRTSLLLLVSAFLEPERDEVELKYIWKDLYQKAIDEEFRLFSYGDGMLIL